MEGKVCVDCKQWKVVGEFSIDNHREDGYQSQCRVCQSIEKHSPLHKEDCETCIYKIIALSQGQ